MEFVPQYGCNLPPKDTTVKVDADHIYDQHPTWPIAENDEDTLNALLTTTGKIKLK